ncbi:MAG: ATP-binding protein, partial [Chloroflexota bacterium]
TGPGGVGKTRLAQQAAAEVMDRYADGTWLVELAAVETAGEVAPAILEAMQPGAAAQLDGEEPEAALRQRLKERETLLVLDNVEHLPGAAKLIAGLIAGAPGVRVMATSRAPLRVRAEREYPVEPLAAPERKGGGQWRPGENAAVDLFGARARAINPGFAADEDGMAAIAAICRALDGLPLAIELAAARTRMLSPVQLLARLGERLPLLTGGARDLPARQRTMRDAIAWSVDLLPPGERALYGRLAVFHGGASLEAIEAVAPGPGPGEVCADPFDGTAALAEQSLIRLVPGASGERVTMLETIREYAEGILAADPGQDAVRERHARWSLELAEQAAAAWGTADDVASLTRMADEQANLRAALGWLGARDVTAAARLGAALGRFWRVRGMYREGRSALETLIAAADAGDLEPALQADLLNAAANLAECQRDGPAATAWFSRAVEFAEVSGHAERLTSALMGLGRIAQARGELARATDLQERVLAVSRAAGDEQGEAYALANLGIVAATSGDAAAAEARLEESVAILRRLGDVGGLAACVTSLGTLVFQQGHVDRAVVLWEEGLAAWETIGDQGRIADTLANLGEAASLQGDLEGATALLRRAMTMREELGDFGSLANELAVLGHASAWSQPEEAAGYLFRGLERARETGEPGTEAVILEGLAAAAAAGQAGILAARLLGAAAELRRQTGIPIAPVYREGRWRAASRARELCGERGFRDALSQGRQRGREVVVAEAAAWWPGPSGTAG